MELSINNEIIEPSIINNTLKSLNNVLEISIANKDKSPIENFATIIDDYLRSLKNNKRSNEEQIRNNSTLFKVPKWLKDLKCIINPINDKKGDNKCLFCYTF